MYASPHLTQSQEFALCSKFPIHSFLPNKKKCRLIIHPFHGFRHRGRTRGGAFNSSSFRHCCQDDDATDIFASVSIHYSPNQTTMIRSKLSLRVSSLPSFTPWWSPPGRNLPRPQTRHSRGASEACIDPRSLPRSEKNPYQQICNATIIT